MPHLLKNNNLKISIDAPLENYKSSRFDWTGKITTVKFQDKIVSGSENPDGKNQHLLGQGFYNEFGIDNALGFNETAIGGWFHKIGVGLLKKVNATYSCGQNYEIKPADFAITSEQNKVILICKSKSLNGYSYILKKEIELHNSSFTILYNFQNTGEKAIVTDEYVHNFMSINKDAIGRNYQLNFPFQIQPELFEETVNPEQNVNIGLNTITFNDTINKEFFFSNLSGNENVTAKWELTNSKSTIRISETGSFKTNKVNIWGQKHVISPELFFNINLQPGKSKQWSRHYQIGNVN